jgi:hypothetical protein
MKTRDQEIIELTQALKSLGYDVEKLELEHSGSIDDPGFVRIKVTAVKTDRKS